MMKMLGNLIVFIWSRFRITANLAAENLALRQQLAVMEKTNKRPIQSRPAGKCKILALPWAGGLHYRYEWKKAA
jgi:hypothetical protein